MLHNRHWFLKHFRAFEQCQCLVYWDMHTAHAYQISDHSSVSVLVYHYRFCIGNSGLVASNLKLQWYKI